MPSRLARGVRVGDRYRLERELGDREHGAGPGATWEAVDERLDRAVALRLFDPSMDRATIVRRAGLAASLTHPRVVRVFDTGEESGRFFTVSELVPDSLRTVRLPLSGDATLRTAIDIAEALHYAHERGVVHGNLHEGNVLLSESGAKVGDFALTDRSEHAERADDLRSFGALMRRVSRIPDPDAPPGLTRVVDGLANGAYGSAAEVLGELRALRPVPSQPRAAAPRRGWLAIGIAIVLALLAFGALRLGERSGGQHMIPGGRIDGNALEIASADDHDPPPGDGVENPGTVANAIDGDPATFWTTERYRESPDFNARKDGVGLILDLAQPTQVGKAQILWAAQGCSFEIRHADEPSAPVDEWSVAAAVDESPASAALEFPAAEARYWMLWITNLTAAGNGYQCGVREVDLFEP